MIFTDPFSTPTPVCLSGRNPFVSSHNALLSDTLLRNESPLLNADGDALSKQDSQTATVETRGQTIQLPFEGKTQGANVESTRTNVQRSDMQQTERELGNSSRHQEKFDPHNLGQLEALLLRQSEDNKALQLQVIELNTSLSRQYSLVLPDQFKPCTKQSSF